jgi:AcrR family transcriptional regulator
VGRRQSIDRDSVLDAAERVVARDGALALTLDAVATEAGVSKGGVQYCYNTKDALIEAMVDRVMTSYNDSVKRYLAAHSGEPSARVLAHVEATRAEDVASGARSSALLASLVRAPDYQREIKQGYREIFDGVDAGSNADSGANSNASTRDRALIAMLAAEGAFLLRGLGLHDIGEQEWERVFAAIRTLVTDAPAPTE